MQPKCPVEFTYATYWNDFTHYSVYDKDENVAEGQEYRISKILKAGQSEENAMFEDREKYITKQNE